MKKQEYPAIVNSLVGMLVGIKKNILMGSQKLSEGSLRLKVY